MKRLWLVVLGLVVVFFVGTVNAQCTHSPYVIGDKLDSNCSECVSKVCSIDNWCCVYSWDSICVSEAKAYCGASGETGENQGNQSGNGTSGSGSSTGTGSGSSGAGGSGNQQSSEECINCCIQSACSMPPAPTCMQNCVEQCSANPNAYTCD